MDTKQYQTLPAMISISSMAKLLSLSRSRLYQLIEGNILLKPAYLISNRRPVYTNEMAIRNLEAKRNNTGINGKVIIFYSARKQVVQKMNNLKSDRRKPNLQTKNNQYADLIEELNSLGLEDVSEATVAAAISELFPNGTENIDKDEILTSVFRHLKRQNTEHKPRT